MPIHRFDDEKGMWYYAGAEDSYRKDGGSFRKHYYPEGDVILKSRSLMYAKDDIIAYHDWLNLSGMGITPWYLRNKEEVAPVVFESFYVPPKWDPEETWCVPREMVEKVLRN